MKKQPHLSRAISWFNQLRYETEKRKLAMAKYKYSFLSYEFNMWIELFEAAEAGEI